MSEAPDVSHFAYDIGKGRIYHNVKIKAGLKGVERIVPPAGEDHAWLLKKYRNEVEVSVSPTGRSVVVFVNGEKVYP